MTTTLIEHHCPKEDGRLWFVRPETRCPNCQAMIHERAPWSYEELIGAIGLRAMYQQTIDFSLTNGIKMPSEREWITGSLLVLVQPSMYIRALQASVVMQPANLRVAPTPAFKELAERANWRGV